MFLYDLQLTFSKWSRAATGGENIRSIPNQKIESNFKKTNVCKWGLLFIECVLIFFLMCINSYRDSLLTTNSL